MSSKHRIAKQIERTFAHCPEIRAIYVEWSGNEGAVLCLLPEEMRKRVVFAKNARMKARVQTEMPGPRNGPVEEEPGS